MNMNKANENKSVECDICHKTFSTNYNVNKHRKIVHNLNSSSVHDRTAYNYKCNEINCNSSFFKCSALIEHLRTTHGFTLETEKLQFKSIEEFYSWKSDIEKDETVNYMKPRGKSAKQEKYVEYYYCHRTGYHKDHGSNKESKRQTKSQGSAKLKQGCISNIKVTVYPYKVEVHWDKTHYGHNKDLQHVRISHADKSSIASKLMAGVPKTRILDDLRSNIGDNLKRVDLTLNQDIENIRRKYNIQRGVYNKDDAISVSLQVLELKSHQNSPVLLYKEQSGLIEDCILDKDDFCLILMNEYQMEMLKEYGQNIIAIDSTHGLNGYDFELTTVMVVDNFLEGFPVAYMFTNRKDTLVHSIFFEKIREKLGSVIHARTFMTDITNTFYQAWTSVMGEVENQLYCSWHVDRAWQTNLSKITNLEKRNMVYKSLKTLQQCVNQEVFFVQLNTFLQDLLQDFDTVEFGTYFRTYYVDVCEKWAYCFRKHLGINTNMYLESMHKTIKYFYLDGKKVKRLDRGLHAILQYTRDKMVDRIIKQTKGKRTVHSNEIFKRHRVAATSNFLFDQVPDAQNAWTLHSEDMVYHINKVSSEKCCQVLCEVCDICIHSFSCTCTDFYIKGTICKHIHYIVLKSPATDSIPTTSHQEFSHLYVDEKIQGNTDLQTNINCLTQQNHDILAKKESIKQKILEELATATVIVNSLETSDKEYLNEVLKSAKSLTNLLRLPEKPVLESEHQNMKEQTLKRKLDVQKRFFSTKKKTKSTKSILSKPNRQEATVLSNTLQRKEYFISTCSDNDHKYSM